MKRTFSKGFEPGAVAPVLAMKAGPERQAALDSLNRLGQRKLVSPSAGVLASLPPHVAQLRPPADDSIEMAADLAELGAMAILRDIHPAKWSEETAAIAELSQFPGLPQRLFGLPNDPIKGTGTVFGREMVDFGWRKLLPWSTETRAGSYGATAEDHAALQRGDIPKAQRAYRGLSQDWSNPTLRALASIGHLDQPYLLGLFMAFQLQSAKAKLSSRFPVLANETGFVSHGGFVDLQCAIAEATRLAMQWTWAIKNAVCAARPEELWPAAARGELHPDLLAKAPTIMRRVGPHLPMVYAEGAPLHPAYPSGHAAIAGACATILCAWFADGEVPAMKISALHAEIRHALWVFQVLPRMAAGVHFRADCEDGLKVGEEAALHYLREVKQFEPLGQTTFTGFFGREITV